MEQQNLLEKSIPATGEKIPAIGLGTWQTFDTAPAGAKASVLEQVLSSFVAQGGKLVDCSPMYGRAEQLLGALAQKQQLHDSLFMATKVWTSGKDRGIQQMNTSMELLKVPVLDLMQVHNLLDYKEHLKTLQAWKEEGRVRYIGITHYTTASHEALMGVMKEFPVDFVQFNYSIQSRAAEKSILPFAADQGVAVLVNRPFEEGALFSRVKGKPLPAWAAAFDCQNWAQFFLKYIISHPAVSCVIPATASPDHLESNMAAGRGKMPDEAARIEMAAYFDRF